MLKNLWEIKERIEEIAEFIEEIKDYRDTLDIDVKAIDREVVDFLKSNSHVRRCDNLINIEERNKSLMITANGKRAYIGKFLINDEEAMRDALSFACGVLVKDNKFVVGLMFLVEKEVK